MKPLKHKAANDSVLAQLFDFDVQFDESAEPYRRFATRLERDLEAMVDRWLFASAPCAARGGFTGRARS